MHRVTTRPPCRLTSAAALLAVCAFTSAPATATQATDLKAKISATSSDIGRYLDLLNSANAATRIAAFTEMAKSGNPALVDVAIETALGSDDRTLQALALRAGFLQVRSIVALLKSPSGTESSAVTEACGDAVQYQVENFSYNTGHFEVRGQHQTGVGQVNGGTVSLTIEYGCSLTGSLSADGSLSGIVSAPYKKGALPARITFR
jgi:hypothetical protein